MKYKPIKIKDMHDDSWVGKCLPPDPLYCNVLGPPNDVFDLMEKVFTKEKVTEFYKRNNENQVMLLEASLVGNLSKNFGRGRFERPFPS